MRCSHGGNRARRRALRNVAGHFSLSSGMTPQFLLLGVIWYIVFLFSTTCHEGAHALIARIGGDPTAFHGGQVTLNPWPHIRREPFGLVVVPILSYFVAHWMIGWASAPYDPAWQQRYPRRAACDGAGRAGGEFYAGDSVGDRDPHRDAFRNFRRAGVGGFHAYHGSAGARGSRDSRRRF